MRLLKERLVLRLIALIVCCHGASYSFADSRSETNEARIEKLEAVVSSLEKRISALEGASVQNPTDSDNTKTASGWKSKSNWRLLSKGMTKSQVRNILGEPEKIDAGGPIENWYWIDPSGPGVTFYDEKLYGWKEPD